jgi:hypothetical protein
LISRVTWRNVLYNCLTCHVKYSLILSSWLKFLLILSGIGYPDNSLWFSSVSLGECHDKTLRYHHDHYRLFDLSLQGARSSLSGSYSVIRKFCHHRAQRFVVVIMKAMHGTVFLVLLFVNFERKLHNVFIF